MSIVNVRLVNYIWNPHLPQQRILRRHTGGNNPFLRRRNARLAPGLRAVRLASAHNRITTIFLLPNNDVLNKNFTPLYTPLQSTHVGVIGTNDCAQALDDPLRDLDRTGEVVVLVEGVATAPAEETVAAEPVPRDVHGLVVLVDVFRDTEAEAVDHVTDRLRQASLQ